MGLVDCQGNVIIYLDKISHIDAAIKNKSHAKFFHQEKIGQSCLLAFDESKRILVLYASARVCSCFSRFLFQVTNQSSQMQLHIFVFDEELKSLRGLGTVIDLLPFYDTGVSIVHACFIHGREEILFVDSSAQARIFSLITLRPKYILRLFTHTFLTPILDPPHYSCHRYRALFTHPRMGHVCSRFKKRTEYLR